MFESSVFKLNFSFYFYIGLTFNLINTNLVDINLINKELSLFINKFSLGLLEPTKHDYYFLLIYK